MKTFDDTYADCVSAEAVLLVQGANLDLLASALGMAPLPVATTGGASTRWMTKDPRTAACAWSLSSAGSVDSRDLRRHLQWLVDAIAPRSDVLRQLQATEGVVLSVRCLWQLVRTGGGVTLWPEQMRALSSLGLECKFEITFVDEGSSDAERSSS